MTQASTGTQAPCVPEGLPPKVAAAIEKATRPPTPEEMYLDLAAKAELVWKLLATIEADKARMAEFTSDGRKTRKDVRERFDADNLDHRIQAAMALSEARDLCKQINTPFKSWCTKRFDVSYDYLKREADLGDQPDVYEAVEAARKINREQTAAARAAKQEEKALAAQPGKVDRTLAIIHAIKYLPDLQEIQRGLEEHIEEIE